MTPTNPRSSSPDPPALVYAIEEKPIFGKDYLHPCALHGEDEHWYATDDPESVPGCPNCGCMLETESCIWCGANWLAFGSDAGDDVMRPATVSASGDLMCSRCYEMEADEEEQDYSEDWEDDYP